MRRLRRAICYGSLAFRVELSRSTDLRNLTGLESSSGVVKQSKCRDWDEEMCGFNIPGKQNARLKWYSLIVGRCRGTSWWGQLVLIYSAAGRDIGCKIDDEVGSDEAIDDTRSEEWWRLPFWGILQNSKAGNGS